jgi:hypothetical protein
MIYIGRPCVLYQVGALAVETMDIRPPEGFEWIFYFFAWNEDKVADVGGTNYIIDVERNLTVNIGSATLSTNEWMYFPVQLTTLLGGFEFRLTHNFYLRLAAAVGAGKKITAYGLYTERPENFELLVEELKAYSGKYKLPISSRE